MSIGLLLDGQVVLGVPPGKLDDVEDGSVCGDLVPGPGGAVDPEVDCVGPGGQVDEVDGGPAVDLVGGEVSPEADPLGDAVDERGDEGSDRPAGAGVEFGVVCDKDGAAVPLAGNGESGDGGECACEGEGCCRAAETVPACHVVPLGEEPHSRRRLVVDFGDDVLLLEFGGHEAPGDVSAVPGSADLHKGRSGGGSWCEAPARCLVCYSVEAEDAGCEQRGGCVLVEFVEGDQPAVEDDVEVEGNVEYGLIDEHASDASAGAGAHEGADAGGGVGVGEEFEVVVRQAGGGIVAASDQEMDVRIAGVPVVDVECQVLDEDGRGNEEREAVGGGAGAGELVRMVIPIAGLAWAGGSPGSLVGGPGACG